MKQRHITEVWDYRLSTAQPINYRGGLPGVDDKGEPFEFTGTWWACVYSQGDGNAMLECHDTGVDVKPGGDDKNPEGLDACYDFYRSVRDKYSRDDIEELKEKVADIRVHDKLRQKATDAYNEVMKGKDAANDAIAGDM